MVFERLFDDLAELVVVIESLDLGNTAEPVEGLKVKVVHMTEMSVPHHEVGEFLHLPQTVGDSVPIR